MRRARRAADVYRVLVVRCELFKRVDELAHEGVQAARFVRGHPDVALRDLRRKVLQAEKLPAEVGADVGHLCCPGDRRGRGARGNGDAEDGRHDVCVGVGVCVCVCVWSGLVASVRV